MRKQELQYHGNQRGDCALGSSGCHRKIPQTGWLKEQIILQFWRLEVHIRVPAWLTSGETSSLGLQTAASSCVLT